MRARTTAVFLIGMGAAAWLTSCSMREEIRRIEEVKKARAESASSRSTNLSGEQLFIRSCNTCHPGGGKGPQAPSLISMDKDYIDDAKLRDFIRKGKGIMPPLPVSDVNEQEMDSLVRYLRNLNQQMREDEANNKKS